MNARRIHEEIYRDGIAVDGRNYGVSDQNYIVDTMVYTFLESLKKKMNTRRSRKKGSYSKMSLFTLYAEPNRVGEIRVHPTWTAGEVAG